MLQVIDYSERAIAVIGTEKGNQEQITALKGMKGKYNPSLRCGKGWVFSKAKNGEQVKAWVAMWNAAHADAQPSAPVQPQTPAPPKPQPTPAPSPQPQSCPEPTPQPQTINQAPKAVVIPMVDDADELEGAPF